jgi:hypothetical protein
MKTARYRWFSLLATLAFIAIAALPAQAARFRRVVPVQVQTFQVASNAVIAVGTNHSASLASLRPGDHVALGFREENGAFVAHRVADGVPRNPRDPKATNPAGKAHHAQKADNLAHVHGIIRFVNIQGRTVTIAYRGR